MATRLHVSLFQRAELLARLRRLRQRGPGLLFSNPRTFSSDSGIRRRGDCAARQCASVSTSELRKRSCGSFGWDGNCKVEPPLSFDVVLFGPLENEISQINLRVFVQNSPLTKTRQYSDSSIALFSAIYRWQLDCIANRERRRTKDQGRAKVLRIRRSANGEVVFSLSGRMCLEDIAELETQIKSEASGRQLVLDLRHVTLVGQDAIAFLARCEADNITLKNCAAYVREWITRQRESS